MEEKEKHLKEIASLKQAAVRSRKWADKNEATKIGYDPVKEHDRSGATRAYIGAKTKKMQSRVTQYERRMEREIQEKEGLLQDIEQSVSLKLMPLSYHKERLISCKELSVRYEGAEDDVLKNLTFELVQGERVFLHGENGCGKSTLIKLLLKELEPTSGTIKVNGQILNKMKRWRVPKYRRGVGVVFQDFRLLKDRNVYENVAFAQRVIEKPNRVIKKRVPEVLTLVGLAEKYKSFPKELSGGEQQRVAVARAIVNRPDILVADEPTGNLDPGNSMEIMKLLEEINNRGTTVLVVTHNREIVNSMKKRVITMRKGVVVSDEKEGEYHEV